MRTFLSLLCFVMAVSLFTLRVEGPEGTFIEDSLFIFILIMVLPIGGLLFALKAKKWKTFVILINILGILTITLIEIVAAMAFA
ncbi:hypothetical protein [Halobacillus sp. H74]|uniref:hypothetical protein n=1 Tax=Halobacillus sp. H74 TaxID=3457436 RepID=UPI003FCC75E5